MQEQDGFSCSCLVPLLLSVFNLRESVDLLLEIA